LNFCSKHDEATVEAIHNISILHSKKRQLTFNEMRKMRKKLTHRI